MSLNLRFSAIVAGIVLGAVSGAASALSFPDFTVDPDRNAGTSDSFVADKIVGGYVEVITFGAGTFTYALRWQAGQFFRADGSTLIDGIDSGLGVSYGLYALVTGSGTFSQSGGITTFNTNAGGDIQFYYDEFAPGTTNRTRFVNDADPTTLGNDITDQATLFARTNSGTDIALLASGSAVSGSGTLNPGLSTCTSGGGSGINCGSFGQTSAIELNAAGRNFFTQPIPFYNAAFNSGQLNNFDVSGTQVINGSMDLVFNRVPEPTTLALVGVALLGLGAVGRRRRQA